MTRKPLTFAEGMLRGKQDKAARNCFDPFRWIKAWAPEAYAFERGYWEGFYS